MTPLNIRLLTICILLSGTSHVSAHDANGTATLIHYLTSPDHVALLSVFVLSAIATYVCVKRNRLRTAKIDRK